MVDRGRVLLLLKTSLSGVGEEVGTILKIIYLYIITIQQRIQDSNYWIEK